MRKIILVLLLAIVLPLNSYAADTSLENAPLFSLLDTNGNKISLEDLKGKTVVLEWTNPDCPYVKRHYREETMKKLAAKYADKNVTWLSINSTHYMDDTDNKDWVSKRKILYPVLNDREGKVGKLYDAKTTPHMFIINSDGKLMYRGAIDDDPKGAKANRTNYVDKALSEILSGKEVELTETTSYGCSVKYKG